MSDLIDFDHLHRLVEGDDEVMQQVLDLFVAQTRGWSERLLAATDADAIGDICHTIRGSSASIGAHGLADACAAAEAALTEGETVDGFRDRLTGLARLIGSVAAEADGRVAILAASGPAEV